jgi:malonate decarboxylase beta subunit
MTGCFGGMSLAAGLASYVVMTPEARLSMNGPEVIEQEAGVDEIDSRDKPFIWSYCGGRQRYGTRLADVLVEDDAEVIAASVRDLFRRGLPAEVRSSQHELFLDRLGALDPNKQWTANELRDVWKDVSHD